MNIHKISARTITILILTCSFFLSVLPFYWLLISAVKPASEIFSKPSFIPEKITLENFGQLFSKTMFLRNIYNSIIIASFYAASGVIICSMAGFGLAKYPSRIKKFVFALVIAALLIPSSVLVVPIFILVTKFHIANTYQGIILPFLANSFGVFWMNQYISGVPNELLQAARIDGAGDLRIYSNILLPAIRPGIAALAIFLFMQQWNDFLWPLVVLSTENMYTIPIALSMLKGVYSMQWGQLMAGAAISVLPFVVLFILLQKYFIAGILAGSLKG
ncbi:MAG: carbohydrate ABC transporter permease [Treponema sp.]|jgi:lactose/L-arabinose transport system permease protein|nr:carbohydrate ABC transporter permease [Treponema sp.]